LSTLRVNLLPFIKHPLNTLKVTRAHLLLPVACRSGPNGTQASHRIWYNHLLKSLWAAKSFHVSFGAPPVSLQPAYVSLGAPDGSLGALARYSWCRVDSQATHF
jgi:hypothetical protein